MRRSPSLAAKLADMFARFDDLRPHRRRSFQLTDFDDVLVAHSRDEVQSVLADAEQAVKQNKWVAGFVTYEASPAFDDALAVRDTRTSAVEGLPLAWFGIFSNREPTSANASGYRIGEWTPSVSAAQYESSIDTIREHIRQGRTYQVNHTFRLDAPFTGDAAGLYRDLSSAQTCGYGSYIDIGRWAIASASPELFFEWRHDQIKSRPMKGTTRRGTTLADDERRRAALFASEKERAENLMIVDMVRNDLGRISRVGTVHVPELFTTEKYDTVWQMTSTVSSRPVAGATLLDVFGALFPCASITGAPKVATMEIISQLETTPRGVYCGTIGFGGPGPTGPEWAFNVAIRTVLVDRDEGRAIYGTGGGITYDSTAGNEYAEALLKTEVLERRTADLKLIETMRWEPTVGFARLADHLSRLSKSAWYFDVPVDPAEVRASLDRAISGCAVATRVRLLVDRTGWITVETAPIDQPVRHVIRMVIDDHLVEPSNPFLYHKTTNRTTYLEASKRHPTADDVVLVNTKGNVTETTIANVAARIDGVWVTPPVEDGLLAGIMRGALIDDGTLTEKSFTVDELLAASAVARMNAVRGWEEATVESSLQP